MINAAKDCRPPPSPWTSGSRRRSRASQHAAQPGVESGDHRPLPEGTLGCAIRSRAQDDVEVAVTAGQDGRFEAPLKVPGGTFVGTYTLELRVDCAGRERVAKATLGFSGRRGR